MGWKFIASARQIREKKTCAKTGSSKAGNTYKREVSGTKSSTHDGNQLQNYKPQDLGLQTSSRDVESLSTLRCKPEADLNHVKSLKSLGSQRFREGNFQFAVSQKMDHHRNAPM